MGSVDSSLDDLCSVCGHPRRRHDDPPTADCASCSSGWKHEFQPKDDLSQGGVEESEELKRCTAQLHRGGMDNRFCVSHAGHPGRHVDGAVAWSDDEAVYPVEPPLSPEEEEMVQEDQEALERAPEPLRRPPYAVAYSAGGAAYEVLLPGDAVAHAEDGVLKISHQGEPVLGIIRVMPVELKERSA